LNIVLQEIAIPEYEDLSHRIADVYHVDVLLTTPATAAVSSFEDGGMLNSVVFLKGDVQNETLLRRLYEHHKLHSGVDVRSCIVEILSIDGVDEVLVDPYQLEVHTGLAFDLNSIRMQVLNIFRDFLMLRVEKVDFQPLTGQDKRDTILLDLKDNFIHSMRYGRMQPVAKPSTQPKKSRKKLPAHEPAPSQ
jgi:hypothetical protein